MLDPQGNPLPSSTGEIRRVPGAEDDEWREFTYHGERQRWLGETVPQGQYGGTELEIKKALKKGGVRATPIDKTGDLIEKLNDMGPGVWEKGMFDGDLAQDLYTARTRIAVNEATLDAMHAFLARPGVVGRDIAGGVDLREAWQNAGRKVDAKSGFRREGLRTWVQNNLKDEYDPAVQTFIQAGLTPEEAAEKAADEVIAGSNPGEHLKIDPRAADAMAGYGGLTSPKFQNSLTRWWDKLQSVYKSACIRCGLQATSATPAPASGTSPARARSLHGRWPERCTTPRATRPRARA